MDIMVEVKAPKSNSSILPSWFRRDDDDKLRWFALWLLVWNCAAGADALAFTFTPAANLDNYYGEGRWNDVTFAQTRMLANCQLGLVGWSVWSPSPEPNHRFAVSFRFSF